MKIDLRSDACTLPTAAMRQAIAECDVGNDDFSEDPTIQKLEQKTAALLEKEAAVFVQSGTMANMMAILSQLREGESLLTSKRFHIFDHEGPAVQRIARCSFLFLGEETDSGITRLQLGDVFRIKDQRRVRLLSLENTVNRLGGTLLPPSHLEELFEWAHEASLKVHLDGARLFNAAMALGVFPAQLARSADTVMVVFTKALAAPAGAVLAGSEEDIAKARRFRWMLGGNWKQGGVVAAACLVALETMMDRIVEDHRMARRLAEGLNQIPGIEVDLSRVVTNIVQMRIVDPSVDCAKFTAFLEKNNVRIGRIKQGNLSRLVTHKDISPQSVERFLSLVREALQASTRTLSSPPFRQLIP